MVPYKTPPVRSIPSTIDTQPGSEFNVSFGPSAIQTDVTIPGPSDITYKTPVEKTHTPAIVPAPRYKTKSYHSKSGKRKTEARSSRFPELVSKRVKKPYISRNGIRIKTPQEINRDWDTSDDDSE